MDAGSNISSHMVTFVDNCSAEETHDLAPQIVTTPFHFIEPKIELHDNRGCHQLLQSNEKTLCEFF